MNLTNICTYETTIKYRAFSSPSKAFWCPFAVHPSLSSYRRQAPIWLLSRESLSLLECYKSRIKWCMAIWVVLDIINNTAMNIHMQVFGWTFMLSFLLCIYLRVEWLSGMVSTCLTFKKLPVFQSGCSTLYSHQQHESSSCSTSLSKFGAFNLLNFSHSNMYI